MFLQEVGGKSILLGMISRGSSASKCYIIGGGTGKRAKEFIENDLGPEGLSKSVIVVSASDQPAPMRVVRLSWQQQLQKVLGMKAIKFFL